MNKIQIPEPPIIDSIEWAKARNTPHLHNLVQYIEKLEKINFQNKANANANNA